MNLSELDFELPKNLIAQYPAEKRDRSRMMLFSRAKKKINHTFFYKISEYLEEGDLLVINDSKVIKARIFLKLPTGGKIEIFFLSEIRNDFSQVKPRKWECLIRPSRKIKPGIYFEISEGFEIRCIEELGMGRWVIECHCEDNFFEELENSGQIPLPPYIHRVPGKNGFPDEERYQTIYGRVFGSVAAPTAGLHFTEELLEDIRAKRIRVVPVTMNIGYGTFSPIKVEEVGNHKIHSEYFRISPESAEVIQKQKKGGKRIVAVGTSTVRTLETAFNEEGCLQKLDGFSDLFIYPGYTFKMVDAMITNFHLPRSSLIALVMAFCGVEELRKCYQVAVIEKYRFFSYGDSMLIL